MMAVAFVSCDGKDDGYKYPKSKMWKHRVITKEEAKANEHVFDGLEIDVLYSKNDNNFYLGRKESDISNGVLFSSMLDTLKRPKKMCYWIDFKNLNANNAKDAALAFDSLTSEYKVKDKVFVENQSVNVLKHFKENGFYVMLWIDNFKYWKSQEREDTIKVCKRIKEKISELNPDAISCEYNMFPLLCDSFPEQNIHFWDTPKKFTPENVEFTKKLCSNESVKIVLVDYPYPVED